MDLLLGLLAAITFIFSPPATGPPEGCKWLANEVCCDWSYQIDAFCCPADAESCEDDCSNAERDKDARAALHAVDSYCLRLWRPVWTYNGGGLQQGGRHQMWELYRSKQFKALRALAQAEIDLLVRLGDCQRGQPCDDELEFFLGKSDGNVR